MSQPAVSMRWSSGFSAGRQHRPDGKGSKPIGDRLKQISDRLRRINRGRRWHVDGIKIRLAAALLDLRRQLTIYHHARIYELFDRSTDSILAEAGHQQ